MRVGLRILAELGRATACGQKVEREGGGAPAVPAERTVVIGARSRKISPLIYALVGALLLAAAIAALLLL